MASDQVIDLSVRQQRIDDGTRRLMELRNLNHRKYQDAAIYFDLVDEHDVPPPRVLDGFVASILLAAMRAGRDVRIHGKMSAGAMRNLYELQEAWSVWVPAKYHKVRLQPDDVVDDTDNNRPDEAIAAFSGGVDSTFTVLRHATRSLGDASYPLKKNVLLVHGFDIPLDRPDHLYALMQRTAPLMQELGLTVRVLRTNIKQLDLERWEDVFMAELAGCLHNYSHEFSHALVASAKSYDTILLPLGSTPLTDHLLSGSHFNIIHDGAGYSRTAKTAEIAKNPTATAVVKVCWEGAETYTNCGVCEKCIRTQLNFRAAGLSAPACFDGAPDPTAFIDGMLLRNDSMCVELSSIVTYAHAHGVSAPWLDALERRVARYRAEKAEFNYGGLRTAWSMARRGDWGRLAERIGRKARKTVGLAQGNRGQSTILGSGRRN